MNKMIVANWKMNGSFELVNRFLEAIDDTNFIFSLPNVFLAYAHFRNKNIKLAVQDCSVFEKFGAHTGEVSSDLIKDAGASYVILGHSERRATSAFDDVESIYKKLKNSLNSGLKVILCIDENYQLLIDEKTNDLLKQNPNDITLAYEPLSAIGTGKTPSPDEIVLKISDIKQKYFNIKTLYGGSVNSNNIHDILDIHNIDGVLIGGASLKLNEIQMILHYNKNVA